mgnify:CR=1 FL=1
MKKDVLVTVIGSSDLDPDEALEVVTPGRFYEKDGKKYIIYEESELTGFSRGVKTTLKINGQTLTMSRNGKGGTNMVFESGKTHLGHYETPYGSFTVSTTTDTLDIAIGETEGSIKVNYFVDVNNIPQSENELSVHVREI